MTVDGALCTFEQDSTCGMETSSENGWTIAQSPTCDHTTGTDQGNIGSDRYTFVCKILFLDFCSLYVIFFFCE